jgi:endoglucanase
MSFYWSSEPDGYAYYNPKVVQWLQSDWSVSVIRVPLAVEAADNAPATSVGYEKNAAVTLSRVKTVVDAAIAQGLYVIVDWHCPIGNPYTTDAVTAFGQLATTYKNVPNVLWEVWNEPDGVGNQAVTNHATSVIAAIRKAGNTNLVIVGSETWSSQPDQVPAPTDPSNNLAYTLHFYAQTHDPNGGYFTAMTNAISNQRTVFVTEWGTTTANGASYTNFTNSQAWLDHLDQYSVSSCNWDIGTQQLNPANSTDNTVQGSAAMFRGASINGGWNPSTDLTPGGVQVRLYLRSKNTGYTVPIGPVAGVDTFQLLTDTIWPSKYIAASGVDTVASSDQAGKTMAKSTAGGSATYNTDAGSTGYYQAVVRVNPGGAAGNILFKADGSPICTTQVSGTGWMTVTDTMQFATLGYHALQLNFSSALSLGYVKMKHLFWTPTGIAPRTTTESAHLLRTASSLILSVPAGSDWTRTRIVDVQGRDLWSAPLDGTARQAILPPTSSRSWVVLDGPMGRDLLAMPPVR